MFRKAIARMVAVPTCLSAAMAGAAEPISLARTEKWLADFDTERCQLLGTFGKDDDRIVIRLERTQPGDWFHLSLIGKQFRSRERHLRMRLAFGPAAEMTASEAMTATTGGIPTVIIGAWRIDNWQGGAATVAPPVAPPEVTPEREAAVRTLDVRVSSRTYRLELDSMAAPMRVMRRCMDELVTSWGFDPVELATLSRPVSPVGNPGTWLRSNDYPIGSLMRGERALIRFRLNIDEAGKAAGCIILSATRPKGFEDITCRLLQRRSSFTPALDKNGKPVKSFWIGAVRWDIPS